MHVLTNWEHQYICRSLHHDYNCISSLHLEGLNENEIVLEFSRLPSIFLALVNERFDFWHQPMTPAVCTGHSWARATLKGFTFHQIDHPCAQVSPSCKFMLPTQSCSVIITMHGKTCPCFRGGLDLLSDLGGFKNDYIRTPHVKNQVFEVQISLLFQRLVGGEVWNAETWISLHFPFLSSSVYIYEA